jgi:hypothetical protein
MEQSLSPKIGALLFGVFLLAGFTAVLPTAHATPTSCQGGSQCSTAFVVFSVGQGGAIVVLSAAGQTNLVGTANTVASTTGICAITTTPSQFGCLVGETGQFTLVSGATYYYTVTFSDGAQILGSISGMTPWTVQVVSLNAA